MRFRIGYLLVVAMVAVGLLAVAPSTAVSQQQVIKWKMQTHLPPSVVQMGDKGIPMFVKQVNEMTQGRLQIELFPVGALMQVADMFDGVSKGVIQIARAWPGYFTGIEPAFAVLSGLPFGLRTAEENLYMFKELGWERIADELAMKHGVHIYNLGLACPYGELSSRVPVRKPADYKGLKIRSYGLYNSIFEAFGGRGITMAPGEIYTGLATGTIDAAIWGGPKNHYDLKLHEVCKYWITPPLAAFITNWDMVNAKAWASLPNDIKLIVEKAAFETMLKYPMYVMYEDSLSLQDMVKNYKVEVCRFSSEEVNKVQAVAMQVWDKAAQKDKPSAELIKIARDFMTLKGYIQ